MNTLWVAAGVLSLVAFFAHAFVGGKELTVLKPAEGQGAEAGQTYIQTRCGWQWVSVDLLFFSILLFIIGVSDYISARQEVSLLICLYFLLCGVVWLTTVVINKTNNKHPLVLGQWIFCFVMSALVYFGQ